ncbi:hypothetical protein QWY93_07030 [Echinicola jeungdonensis]|uniref:CYTH domain-containing protein n=1 Tax=Echinicola jeungdonensis TaxID=709343 RepID=A0ABV5J7F4_9BACT|nr:hypothetical protein [Echinicola jeungdonensis]MDN3669076.1 hypothetical protein [Echinicola jeungdonensis]
MFRSKEIRWFSKEKHPEIVQWFSSQGLTLEGVSSRTDFYLPLPDKHDINVKLREGNIEIKHRLGEREKGKLTSKALGYFEDWVKWSFNAVNNDPLTKAIIQDKKYNWIPVHKTRMGMKVVKGQDGHCQLVPMDQFPPFGCQVEYTRIQVFRKTWFTFGLEWFGEKDLNLDTSLVQEILGESQLEEMDNMGYPEFLSRLSDKQF